MELKNGDCMELLKDIKSESIDAVITDPPYNIGKNFEGEAMEVNEWVNRRDKRGW